MQEVSIAGNTVMEHLFLGISPEPLSKSRTGRYSGIQGLTASEAGLDCDAGIFTSFPYRGTLSRRRGRGRACTGA
ncbi:MAG: hypothetical protein HS130_05810 [Deltaproteobacteria bacterium]|nr:hypothetical protein [Deltaproteobacteria bacterium]